MPIESDYRRRRAALRLKAAASELSSLTDPFLRRVGGYGDAIDPELDELDRLTAALDALRARLLTRRSPPRKARSDP